MKEASKSYPKMTVKTLRKSVLNKILMGGFGVAVILVMILTILYW